MAVKTQGLQVYALAPKKDNPKEMEVFRIGCVTQVEGGEDTREDLQKECLDSMVVEKIPGRIELGDATIGIYPDSENNSSIRLHELYKEGRTVKFAIGLSDGVGIPPTIDEFGDGFDMPKTRTWITFTGTVKTYPGAFPGGGLVSATMAISRKTELSVQWRTEDAPRVTALSFDSETLEMQEGDKKNLVVTASPDGASNAAELRSSDESVATVSQSGEVIAKAEGVTTIEAVSTIDDSIRAKCKVTVTAK